MNKRTMQAIAITSILLCGVVLLSRGTAQDGSAPQAHGENDRFQVSAWSIPALAGGSRYERSAYGAYVIDSQTGDLWAVKGESKPKKIGSVGNQ